MHAGIHSCFTFYQKKNSPRAVGKLFSFPPNGKGVRPAGMKRKEEMRKCEMINYLDKNLTHQRGNVKSGRGKGGGFCGKMW